MQSINMKLDPSDDIQILKNMKTINDCIPFVYKVLLKWGCSKSADQSYWDYIQKMDCHLHREEKKWIKNNRKKLMRNSCNDSDVTFLYSLITHVCSKIHKPGTMGFESVLQNISSVEFNLKATKELRNAVVHDRNKSASSSVINEASSVLINLIEAAGKLYDIDKNEIDEQVNNLSSLLKEIQLLVFDEQRKIKCISEILTQFGCQERREAWKLHSSKIYLPFSRNITLDRNSIFHDVQLSFRTHSSVNLNEEIFVTFPSSQLLSKTEHNLKVIMGVPGSGKTTFLKSILENWLSYDEIISPFEEIEQFNLVILVECRTDSTKTFGDLVKRNFPITLSAIKGKEIEEAVRLMKVLVLIDGYDERNSNSDSLVVDIIENCKLMTNRTVIISTRPHAGTDLIDELLSQELTFDTVTMEGVKEQSQQIQFLRRYHMNIHSNKSDLQSFQQENLVETFKKLPEEVSHMFSFPIYLALFCYLYEFDKSSVTRWRSERNVLQAVYELTERKIRERINNQSQISDSELRQWTKKLMNEICKLSLKMVNDKSYFLSGKDYDIFYDSCCNNISDKISYDQAVSSVLHPETSVYNNQETSFHFLHASTQEYFATKFLCQELEKENILSYLPARYNKIKWAISRGLEGKYVDSKDLKRFSSIMKYLSQELVNNRKLHHCIEDMSKFLHEMGAGYSYCVQMLIASENNDVLCKNIASVISQEEMLWQFYTSSGRLIKLFLKGWRVQNGLQMVATAKLLAYTKPNTLSVFLPSNNDHTNDQLLTLMHAVNKKQFCGNLKLYFKSSRLEICPNDDIILSLKNAKCNIAMFLGCLSSKEALQVLTSMIGRSILAMSIPDPLNHNLDLLQGKFSALGVWVPYVEVPDILFQSSCRPLPTGVPVFAIAALLHIDNIPYSGQQHTQKLIKYLSPKTKKFTQLALDHCLLSDEQIGELLTNLKEEGIRTNSEGDTRFYVHQPDSDGNCSSCYSSHKNEYARCISLHIPSEMSHIFGRNCFGNRNIFMHYYAQIYKKFAFR